MTEAIAQINNFNKKAFVRFLLLFIFAFAFAYVYFIAQTTVNTATYKTLQSQIIALESQIGEVEFEYMTAKNKIGFALAEELNYQEATQISFVDKKSVSNKLSLVGPTN